MSVIWKDIPRYPKYQISELGDVRRVIDGVEKVLSPFSNKSGYVLVNIAKSEEGQPITRLVHRLVALAFIGPPPDEERIYINHKDGVTSNNHPSNLEWVTPQENVLHALENKLTGYTLRVRVYNTQSGEVVLYPSMAAVANHFSIAVEQVKRLIARYPDERLNEVYTLEPLLDEHDPADFEHCRQIVAYDFIGRKKLVADTLGVMSILTGVLTGTIRLNLVDKRYRLIGGYVFKYLSDETPFPEFTVEEAKVSRDKYLLRKAHGGEIIVFDYTKGEEKTYPTIVAASEATKVPNSLIVSRLWNKSLVPYKGFSFKRKEDPTEFPTKSLEAIAVSFMGGRSDGVGVKVHDIKTGETQVHPSIKALSKAIGSARSAIKTHLDKQTIVPFKKRYHLQYV